MPGLINISGQVFGNWTALNEYKADKRKTMWLCKCKCGTEKFVNKGSLLKGNSLSCGCLFPAHNLRHGLKNHPIYKAWKRVVQHCCNPNNPRAKDYSKKGVRICDEWRNNPQAFYDWSIANGWKPGLQIDKDIIPKKLNIPALLYSPEMCCWVTQLENTLNSSKVKLTKEKAEAIRKSSKSNRELANEYGVHIDTIGLIKRNKIWR